MRRIDYLILDARSIAKNEANPDGTDSISDNEVVRYFNDAQDYFQALISATKNTSKHFVVETEISIVGGQQAYSIPDRLYMNKGIQNVEYSFSGLPSDYRRLRKLELFNNDNSQSTDPSGYYRRNGQIFLVGVPSISQGKLKIMYERLCDDLDIRRGQVSTVNGLTSTGFTSIVISSPDETSQINLTNIDYVCVVDSDGNRKAYNIKVGAYGAGTLVPAAGWTFIKAGDTIAVNDYVVLNKWSTTHSQLPDEAEPFLIHYAASCMQAKDNGDLNAIQSQKLQELGEAFIKALGTQTAEVQEIPQLYFDDYWY